MTNPFSGVELVAFVKAESSFDTVQAFAAGDAVAVMSMTIEPELQQTERTEHVGTQSLQGFVRGRRSGRWSMTVLAKTSDVGTPTDEDVVIEAGFGEAGTDTPATSVVYALGGASDTPRSLQIGRAVSTDFFEVITGAWVEEVVTEVPEDGSPTTHTYSGGFSTYGSFRSGPTVNGNHSSSDSTIALNTGYGRWLQPNVRIKFGAEDNSGAGYLVTDVTGDTVTISPGLAGNISGNVALAAVVPTPTTAGTPIGSVDCSFSVDSVAYGLKSATITLQTGVVGLNAECTDDRPNRLSKGPRRVNAEFACYALQSHGGLVGGGWESDTHAVSLRIGVNTAGLRRTIAIPKIMFRVSPYDVPDAEAAMVTLSGIAQQSAAADDEMTWTDN